MLNELSLLENTNNSSRVALMPPPPLPKKVLEIL